MASMIVKWFISGRTTGIRDLSQTYVNVYYLHVTSHVEVFPKIF